MKILNNKTALSTTQQAPRLQSANLEVTQQCDSRCVSCNIWQFSKKPLNNDPAAMQDRELSFKEHIRA